MKCVFGLGNPGVAHRRTRHNLGFLAIDRYLEELRKRKGREGAPSLLQALLSREARQARARLRGRRLNEALIWHPKEDLLLVKPLTWMNRSGLAVREVIERFELELKDCLVIYDDFALPLGELRVRAKGSAGGHRGMSSIIEELGTEEVPRLRIGIGNPNWRGDLTAYVLGEFTPEEWPIIERALTRAVKAIEVFRERGLERLISMVGSL